MSVKPTRVEVAPWYLRIKFLSTSLIHLWFARLSVDTIKNITRNNAIWMLIASKPQSQPKDSVMAPTTGQVTNVPNAFPKRASKNFFFSIGGAHRSIRYCRAGNIGP